jgi:hypothetical protein
VDAERLDLVGQALGQPLERELAGAVEGLERDAEDPADGAEQHDPAAAPLAALVAHGAEHRLHRPHAAPEVGLDLGLGLGHGGVLDGAGDAPAGRGDQRVDAAVLGQDAAHPSGDGLVVVHVHDQAGPPARGRAAAAGAGDGPARGGEPVGAGPPDPRRRAGDQRHPALLSHTARPSSPTSQP